MRAGEISVESDDTTQPIQNPGLEELQAAVTLNNVQLLELSSNDGNNWFNIDKFMEKIMQYNRAGVESIQMDDYERALVYLQEAEKILEYAASCGKTIDRFLIASTLHNEACVYQKLWELDKSSDYMEAILYNMSNYIDSATPVEINHNLKNPNSESYQTLSAFIYRRLSTAVYHLQYSAVNSQIGRHDLAIDSSRKSLQLLSQILS